MKKVRWNLLFVCFVLLVAGAASCGNHQEEISDYYIYYINKEQTKTVAVGYEPEQTDTKEMIQEFLNVLFQDTKHPHCRRPAPKGVKLESWKLSDGQLFLYFNSAYEEMGNIEEVLCRAAMVRTLIQVEGVECISFYIGDAPLVDKEGTPVGVMTAESFIENPGEQINTIQTANITLYFSNQAGNGLVQEEQEIHYSSNISLEKLVMEQLLKGPQGEEGRAAIPDGTKLVGVSVLDGVCFVNFSEGFLNQNYEIAEPVVIYSIVNSLAELSNVNKVQISINGDSNQVYREKMELSVMYERNLDYMDGAKQMQEGKEKKKTTEKQEETGD